MKHARAKLLIALCIAPLYLQAMQQLNPLDIALFNAVRKGDSKLIKTWLRNGASINARDASNEMRTPLFIACTLSHKPQEFVELLLDHHADPVIEDTLGNTPLYYAIANKSRGAIQALLRAGVTSEEALELLKVDNQVVPPNNFPWYYNLPDWMFWIFYKINPKNGGN